jgi:glycosyltransferase involved in cell wall biosynthesis
MSHSPLKVCIDVRVGGDITHGAALYSLALANAICRLSDGDEEYFFLTLRSDVELLRPFIPDTSRILFQYIPPDAQWKRVARRIPGLRPAWRKLMAHHQSPKSVTLSDGSSVPVTRSDGTIERAGIDVIHFPKQNAFRTRIASIYQLHDLQHLHYPEFFLDEEYKRREAEYRTFCRQAALIAVMSAWGKRDLMEQYYIPAERICVVPGAPMLQVYGEPTPGEMSEVHAKFNLPNTFLLFPAQTWRHKNHISLLRALAMLRDQGIVLPLVCTGHRNEFFPVIEGEIVRLGLGDQVRFLGFLTGVELQCLYRLCRCLVYPSKFEGWGLPLTEALYSGAPAACSRIPPLLEQAGDAAAFFDPDDPQEMADVLHRLWFDDTFHGLLSRRGRERAALFTWERTARIFRAHYRRISGNKCALTEQDRVLLEGSPRLADRGSTLPRRVEAGA